MEIRMVNTCDNTKLPILASIDTFLLGMNPGFRVPGFNPGNSWYKEPGFLNWKPEYPKKFQIVLFYYNSLYFVIFIISFDEFLSASIACQSC